jgi:hypothetical protein
MSEKLQVQQRTFFWEQYNRYEDHLRQKGIGTPIEYLEEYGELDSVGPTDQDFIKRLETPLDALYSLHPFLGQDIMYVDLNPGTKSDIKTSFGSSNEYTRKSKTMKGKSGEERLVALTWHMGSHYGIQDQPGRGHAVKSIYNHFSTSTQSFESYLSYENREVIGTAFEDIYFSRMYKWPSSVKTQLKSDNLKFGKKEFLRELNAVEPNLLIVACKDAWDALREDYPERLEIHQAGSSNGEIKGDYGNTAESDIGGIYILDGICVLTLPYPGPRTWNTNPITISDVDDLIATACSLVGQL